MAHSALMLLIISCSLLELSAAQTIKPAQITKKQNLVIQHADIPLYPGIAKVARIGGTVHIEVTVNHGSVTTTSVVGRSAPILVEAATNNIKSWQFLPDVNTTFVTTFVYVINKHETSVPENPRIEMDLPKLVKLTARPAKTRMDCGGAKLYARTQEVASITAKRGFDTAELLSTSAFRAQGIFSHPVRVF